MKVIDNLIAETKWLRLLTRRYTSKNGNVMSWDFVERKNNVEAVVIVARTELTGSYLILKQFRPSFNDYIYEFPAGLIDPAESPRAAALRELREETGYDGIVTKCSKVLSSSGGLTNEKIYLVYVEAHQIPSSEPELEPGENIELIKLKPENVEEFLRQNVIFDAKLYAILNGR